jgi:trehalose synthase
MTGDLTEVDIQALDAARLESLIGGERMASYERVADAARAALAGHSVLNVNSTAAGGGVAEMLQTLLAYVRGAGVDTRWLVIEGDPEFFAITKRIHNGLYGMPGDGGALGDTERHHYEQVLRRNGEELLALLRPGDVVLIHDPQPAGLLEAVKRAGARAIWRCHVGCDEPNNWTERAWEFLRPYLHHADDYVFSRAAFAPAWVDNSKLHVIPPSIDPFSAKNEPMSHRNVQLTLSYVGLLDGEASPPPVPFTKRDGSPGRVNRHVDILQSGPSPSLDAPLLVQVSRWDRLKDMAGVMEGFAHRRSRTRRPPDPDGTIGERRRRRPGGRAGL